METKDDDVELGVIGDSNNNNNDNLINVNLIENQNHVQVLIKNDKKTNVVNYIKRFLAFCWRQLLPLGLITGIVIGILWPTPGKILGSWQYTSNFITAFIFFLSGLRLDSNQIRGVLDSWALTCFACVNVLIITPFFAYFPLLISSSSNASESLSGLYKGMSLFLIVPTTLMQCVILTQQCNGKWGLALFITVVTNILGAFTVPLFVKQILSTGSVQIDVVEMIKKSVIVILVPILLGMSVRIIKNFAVFVDKRKKLLNTLSTFALISVPFIQVSQSADKINLDIKSLLIIASFSFLCHLILLLYSFGWMKIFKVKFDSSIAVILTISQRSLPVALTVLSFFPESDVTGLMAIAMIISHLIQTVTDSIIVSNVKIVAH